MSIMNNIYLRFLRKFKPIQYAKEVGVNVIGAGQKFLSLNFGSEPYLITIGEHVELSSNVHFATHDGGTWVFRNIDKYKDVIKFGAIKICDNCFIGMNTIILPGVTIGPNSVVGAGSVVTNDVLPGTVVAGNPAKMICSVEDYAEKSLNIMPEYDVQEFKKDKKSEVLRAYMNMQPLIKPAKKLR